MMNIIFNYIFGLTFQRNMDFVWKWTLESKSEYIVENNIILFSKNVFASADNIYNQNTSQFLHISTKIRVYTAFSRKNL